MYPSTHTLAVHCVHWSGPKLDICLSQSLPRTMHSLIGWTLYPHRPPQLISVHMKTPPTARFYGIKCLVNNRATLDGRREKRAAQLVTCTSVELLAVKSHSGVGDAQTQATTPRNPDKKARFFMIDGDCRRFDSRYLSSTFPRNFIAIIVFILRLPIHPCTRRALRTAPYGRAISVPARIKVQILYTIKRTSLFTGPAIRLTPEHYTGLVFTCGILQEFSTLSDQSTI